MPDVANNFKFHFRIVAQYIRNAQRYGNPQVTQGQQNQHSRKILIDWQARAQRGPLHYGFECGGYAWFQINQELVGDQPVRWFESEIYFHDEEDRDIFVETLAALKCSAVLYQRYAPNSEEPAERWILSFNIKNLCVKIWCERRDSNSHGVTTGT